MRPIRAVLLLLLAAILAGCSRPADDGPEGPAPLDAYTVTLEGPASVQVGAEATFVVRFHGEHAMQAHHVGAHVADAADLGPGDIEGARGCTHLEGEAALPGTFQVACRFDHVGTAQVRGHALVRQDGDERESFSAEHHVTVFPGPGSYNVTTQGVLAQASAGEPMSFTVHVQGPPGNSTHVGAHFWNASQAEPSGNLATAASCVHPAADHDLPGNVTTSCVFPAPGTYHLRGHARVDVGGPHHFWAAEQVVQVT